MPAGELGHLRVTPELLSRTIAAATRLGRFDKTISQRTAAGQGGGCTLPGARHARPGAFLADPACRKALAERRLVGFSAGEFRLQPLAPVVRNADVADRGDGAVAVANDLWELAALAVDADHPVRWPLGIQRTAS